ncbi:MAG: Mrp/NBP35 family ATP-binding protein [Bacteroidetes bacterium]|nr:Mrp/NBP35 family ATP-binding protein [Bacteroidota bacterium]
MSSITPEAVLDALRTVIDPAEGKDVVRLGCVRDLSVAGNAISFRLVLEDPGGAFAQIAERMCKQAVRNAVGPEAGIRIEMDNEMIGLGDVDVVKDQRAGMQPIGATNVIGVASGKGGVGKSTVAVNLAVSLAAAGYDVGLLDADIYGPSIPTMFGVEGERPRVNDNRKLVPIERHGVKLVSMGFLVEPEKAVVWRGPMVSSAIKQFLGDTDWHGLDYLVIDFPPGTGDIQLTLVQSIPITGAVVVSTPQKVALADARKAVAMFEQVNVPVLGIVENMAWFTPDELPDKRYYLFGKGGASALATELDVPLLAELPIEPKLMEASDSGSPYVSELPDSETSKIFSVAARQVARKIDLINAGSSASGGLEIVYQ